MKREKFKRDYLPKLRRGTKELEDAIIEKNEIGEAEAIRVIKKTIEEIKSSKYIREKESCQWQLSFLFFLI